MKITLTILSALLFTVFVNLQSATGYTVGHKDTWPENIPTAYINAAKNNLHIAYNHTSHGSQLITGLNSLKNYPDFGTRYKWIDDSIGDSSGVSLDDGGIPGIDDLSNGDKDSGNPAGIAIWAVDTYDFLIDTNNYHINVVMWSWCNIGGHNMTRYINSMEWLISLFGEGGSHARAAAHPVQFVFMTGHANGGGIGDSSDINNQVIRAHCQANNRILFDFSDIENYNPDNEYFLNKRVDDALYYDSTEPYDSGSLDANWATQYIASHSGSELDLLVNGTTGYSGCGSCAHSPEGGETSDARLNCVLKGRALWTLFARLAGWDPGTEPPPPPPPGTTNGNITGQLHLLLSE